jgi:hypothetical protein
MVPKLRVYVEVAPKRAFACAIDWPGWCRAGRDADGAIDALIAYGGRYKKALGGAAGGLALPADRSGLELVYRLEGNATTDFGAPAITSPSDRRPIDAVELKRLLGLLEAAWAAFDRAAEGAVGVELRKGPRGGGRDLDKMVAHVREADEAYLSALGARPPKRSSASMTDLRTRILDTLQARATGAPVTDPAHVKSPWEPRFAVRRSAWHALDHAWEIEDRS